jgi:hypothetical protein
MRPDIFVNKKGIHVKLGKDVHAGFRSTMFKHGLSMQDSLEEFARLVSINDDTAMLIIKNLVRRKTKESIEKYRERVQKINELDHDTLYDLIEGDVRTDETNRSTD